MMNVSSPAKCARVVLAAVVLSSCRGNSLPAAFAPTSGAQKVPQIRAPLTHGRYLVIDIGTLGGLQATAEGISDRKWVVGTSNLQGNQTGHAFLWRDGHMQDLGTLGGLNSQEQWPEKDRLGVIAGAAETAYKDPDREDFCGFDANNGDQYTGQICKPFVWQNGSMKALPTLGGRNGQASAVNDLGQIVGLSETSTRDPQCAAPQVYDVKAVIWQHGKVTALAPFRNDAMAWATGINDRGQVIGISGKCMSPNFNGTHREPRHGVIWQGGVARSVGSLGGTKSTFPWAINEAGQVVGQSYIVGNAAEHAFVWNDGVITDLGTLYPDLNSIAFGENERGDVVGGSGLEGTPRAFIWRGGVMTDLNTEVADGSSPDYLFWGNDINDRGEISFMAFNTVAHAVHAAIAIPCSEVKARCKRGNLRVIVDPQTLRAAAAGIRRRM